MCSHRLRFLSSSPAGVLATLLLTLLAGCETKPAVAETPIRFGDIDSLALGRLSDRFLKLAWSLRPDRAQTSLCHRTWSGRTVAGEKEIIAAAGETRNLLARARELESTGLTSDQRRDKELLAAYLESYLVELEQIRTWRRDPGVYLDAITAGMDLGRQGTNPTVRAERTRIHLESIPGLLARAWEGLTNCPRPFCEAAAVRARKLAGRLDSGRGLPHPYQAGLKKELSTAAKAAAAALRTYSTRLEGTALVGDPGSLAMPPEAFRQLLRLREGIRTDPEVLFSTLVEDETTLAAALQAEPSRERGPSIRPTATDASAARGAAPRPTLDEEIAALPECSRLRRGHLCRTFRLGWTAYRAEIRAEGEQRGRRVIARQRWQACLQARLALGLQVGALTLGQMEEELREKLKLNRSGARIRAIDLARDPIQTLGYLVRDFILEQRRLDQQREGRPFDLAAFHRRLLAAGPLPLDYLAERLASEEEAL